MKTIIEIGSRYTKLTVGSIALRRSTDGNSIWNCLCDCGQRTQVLGYNLENNNTKSCGCLVRKHGWHGTSEYRTWGGMKIGLTPSTLNIRLNKGGMSVEEAIATPLMKIRNEVFTYKGKAQTLREWATETGLSYRCLRDRIKTLGWSLEKALETKVGDTPKSHSMR